MGNVRQRATKDAVNYTSVELDGLVVIFWVLSHAIHNGPNTLKSKDFSNQQAEMECPEEVVRKDEEAMEIDCVINDVKNKLCL